MRRLINKNIFDTKKYPDIHSTIRFKVINTFRNMSCSWDQFFNGIHESYQSKSLTHPLNAPESSRLHQILFKNWSKKNYKPLEALSFPIKPHFSTHSHHQNVTDDNSGRILIELPNKRATGWQSDSHRPQSAHHHDSDVFFIPNPCVEVPLGLWHTSPWLQLLLRLLSRLHFSSFASLL